ncbi:hypothetical protein L2K20_17090 [Mycobacterium sp. MBM]|nr:hypothetical protein [Mycobacterium sp. MBM]
MRTSASDASSAPHLRRGVLLTAALPIAVLGAATAHPDNRRLNESVIANVYTVPRQAGCPTEITMTTHPGAGELISTADTHTRGTG